MEIYRYLDAKIEYDNGRAQKIISCAKNALESYRVSEKELSEIRYWLKCAEQKLKAAFLKQDLLLISFLVAAKTWKVLEGVFAVNQQPIPPAGSLYRRYGLLNKIPCQNWFEKLLGGDEMSRGKSMTEIIDWVLYQTAKC